MSPSRSSVVRVVTLALVLSACAERSSPSAVSTAKEAPQQQTPSPQGPPAPVDQPKAPEAPPTPTAGPTTEIDELKVTRAPPARASAAPAANNRRVEASSNGAALSPEIIRRVVRLGYPEVHACYETGLKQNPTLQGRMTVKLVISKEGAPRASVATSDLPDKNVVACVTKAFSSFSFPPPDHGEVTVNYPVAFSPTAAAPE